MLLTDAVWVGGRNSVTNEIGFRGGVVCVFPVELRNRCLPQWFKEIVLSDVTRGDTRGHENGYPGGAGP
jgi:hypothetical protein